MANYFNPDHALESQIRDVSIIPLSMGRFLIASDAKSIFYDLQDKRIQLTDIITLGTEAERTAILAPLDKFYFVKESSTLWRYANGEWKDWPSSGPGRRTSFAKTFSAGNWSNGTITIPVSEHKLDIKDGAVMSKVFLLLNGAYSDQCLAAMDTEVTVSADNGVVLSYSGTGYAGKVVLYS